MLPKKIIAITTIVSTIVLSSVATSYASINQNSSASTTGKIASNGMAMTWVVKKIQVVGGKTYVLIGTDSISNPYQGDTSTAERRSLLCLRKNKKNYPDPGGLDPLPSKTPGGADVYTWSFGKIMVIPNVLGSSLTSQADADNKCNKVGQIVHGLSGFKMAEFHDGTGAMPGWAYWAEGHSVAEGLDYIPETRYWVHINDQPANPWNP